MNALLVRCPHCKAPIGVHCTVPATGMPLTLSRAHPSRIEALERITKP